jgi:hypothetical protein
MASFALIVSNICICRKKNFLNKYNKWKINEEGDKVYVTGCIEYTSARTVFELTTLDIQSKIKAKYIYEGRVSVWGDLWTSVIVVTA